MGLSLGPLRLRIDPEDADPGLIERALSEGIVLAGDGEEADLVARPAAPTGDAVDDLPSVPGTAEGFSPRELEGFSPREREILEYLADGWSNAEIASVLGIGTRTVRFHLENVYARLGVSRRGEAVREALRLGIVRLEF